MAAYSPHASINRLLGLLSTLQGQASPFGFFMQGVGALSVLVHLTFLGLFLWSGALFLAGFNVASVLVHLGVFRLARQGALQASFLLAATEVVLHAVLASHVLGWEAGFHYYIVLVVPVAIVNSDCTLRLKVLIAGGAALSYLALITATRHALPLHAMAQPVLDALQLANALILMVSLGILSSFYYYLIKASEESLRTMASIDPLTQLQNRRAAMAAISARRAEVGQPSRPLSFVLGDLDHFKRINDEHGHAVGDQALQAASAALLAAARGSDQLSRWGGEEFLLMLPNSGSQDAMAAAERLRQAIEVVALATPAGPLRLTMSFGVATVLAGEDPAQAISRADDALYRAKRAGRNRVERAAATRRTG